MSDGKHYGDEILIVASVSNVRPPVKRVLNGLPQTAPIIYTSQMNQGLSSCTMSFIRSLFKPGNARPFSQGKNAGNGDTDVASWPYY